MASTTRTCTLARASVPVIYNHAGTTTVHGSYNSGADVLSLSGSGLLLLCKIPVSSTVTDYNFFNSAGATTWTLQYGFKNGIDSLTTSATYSALLGSATGGQNNGPMAVNANQLPITAPAGSTTLNERFVYVCATVSSATATTSGKVSFSVSYTNQT